MMAKLAIHTTDGNTIEAPFEAWLVAIINSMSDAQRLDVYRKVSRLQGASFIPDKFKVGEDALGGITIVERPILDMKMMKE
jgi:hypothetical protein